MVIGKIPDKRRDGRSSFKDLVEYCIDELDKGGKKHTKVEHVGIQNLLSVQTAALEMEALASDNTRCKDPVFHAILSWREMEVPTKEQIDEAVHILLNELGLSECQVLWALQKDTENRHVHIVINRIHPETARAIQPASNWTFKAIQRAARKIELSQGWKIEQNGTYLVTEDGEIIEKSKHRDPSISQSAKDTEAHTATKSAERIAQEIAAPIMREAKIWQELHACLAEHGIAFEKKGSGAILFVGDIAIKASKAGRDISLSKLISRLGPYGPRPNDMEIRPFSPTPTEKVSQSNTNTEWERYSAERERYFTEKREVSKALLGRQKAEFRVLLDSQKSERTVALSGSWKGRGALLNEKRSLLAAKQQKEKLALKDRHRQEQEELKQCFPRRFPNFKTWLEREEEEKASVLFRYSVQCVMVAGTTTIEGSSNTGVIDLRDFNPIRWNKGGVAYARSGQNEADFIDYGRRIVLNENCDESAVLAALQLANQKWGSAEIFGTDEYKRICVEIAAAHNLRITNPELQSDIAALKKISISTHIDKSPHRKEESTMYQSRRELFTRYADAVGATRFRILVTEFTENGTKAFVYDRKNGGYEGKTKEHVLEIIPKLSALAHYGKNIYVFPLSPDRHHILVDDLTQEKLEQLKLDGYSPACVIESSPANYQAILTVPSVDGDRERDREAANKLTRELNQKYGDPHLSGSVHAHRLPPFPNCKPKHRREDGSYPETLLIEASGGICEEASKQLKAAHEQLLAAQERAESESKKMALQEIPHVSSFASDPDGAYWAHYRDIMRVYPGSTDYSRIDGMIGIRMRVTGYDAGQIRDAIQANAPAIRHEGMSPDDFDRKYKSRDWNRYAQETTEKFVFGVRGISQYEKSREYRPHLFKVEGRNMLEEQAHGWRQRREKEEAEVGR